MQNLETAILKCTGVKSSSQQVFIHKRGMAWSLILFKNATLNEPCEKDLGFT